MGAAVRMASVVCRMALTVAVTVGMATSSASAATILLVDVSVQNQITISGTSGASSATVSGSDAVGVYLGNMLDPVNAQVIDSLVLSSPRDLTTPGDPSSNLPMLFTPLDGGLNLFNWSSDAVVSFTTGLRAFTGSATWDLNPLGYQGILNGNRSGNVFFPAGELGNIGGAVVIGQYQVVPEPSTAALMTLGLVGLAARRRRS